MQTQSRSCSYRYDALDRLAYRSAEQSTVRRFYCSDRLSTESDGDRHHCYLQAGGRLLAQRDSTVDGVQNTPLATDAANSVLVAGSDPLTQVAYSPYGHRDGAALLHGLPGFNGEQPDPLTGHYLLGNGYRAFNPVLMRFNSPDSLSPFSKGGLNAYAYCAGDPVNRFDPTGHWTWMISLGAVVGATAAGAAHFTTKKKNPEVSSVMGVVALGLVGVSVGTGIIAGFQSLTRIANTFTHGLSGRGALAAGRQLGGESLYVHVLSQRPVMENVVKYLPANDILSLSATSRNMRSVIDSSLRPIDKLLSGAKSAAALEGNPDLIRRARDISAGQFGGTTPAQLMRAGIDPNDIPFITDAAGFAGLAEMESRFAWREAARENQRMLRIRLG